MSANWTEKFMTALSHEEKAARIRELNDAFRTTLSGGAVLLSAGVYELPDMVKAAAIRKVVDFDEFTEDNDPYDEHDFGRFELCSSEDPADPQKTTRILTIMLASGY
jgi:Protein of unknown function (DUF3768)